MILKKPYAFLIKHFRLIHIILTAMITYMLVRSFKMYNFFSRYVENIYSTLGDAVPSNYITSFMMIIVILIISFSLLMYLLMNNKKKPKTLYMILSIYYLVFFAGLIGYFLLFKNLNSYSITIKNAMVLRDLTLIVIIPQFIFLILSFIRAVGFDIKKFNFSSDIKELDLSDKDNEEFEFVLGVDSYKYSRFLRRRMREFKYYILENKFMFILLSGLIVATLTTIIILNFTVYNRTYKVNQRVQANNLIISINNSYLTNLDYKGQKIAKNKFFLVANVTFINNSGLSTVLSLSNYELKTKDGTVYPTITRNNHFIDLGADYSKERIENGREENFILVYELNKNQVQDKYTLRIIDEVEYSTGSMNAKVKSIELIPNKYLEAENISTHELKQKVVLFETVLNNSDLTINSYNIANKYSYQFEACIRENCQNKTEIVIADTAKDKTLLILSGELNLDSNSFFVKNNKSSLTFFDAFVKIKYDDKISSVKDVTPSSLVDKYLLEVDGAVNKAKKIDLVISVRGKTYTINLK